MFIEFHGIRFEEGKKGFGVKLPFFKCRQCGYDKCIIPEKQCMDFKVNIMPEIKENEFHPIPLHFLFSKLDQNKKYDKYKFLNFQYDNRDYFLIPGLRRPEEDGYLIPVFFDADILLYYNYHPDYSVELHSFSSGNIYQKGKELFDWGFGINRNGKIFMWLGDLAKDFKPKKMARHLLRFQASNIQSDHDVVSKFYFSQNPFSIEDAFQDSDNEVQLFKLKNKFDDKILNELNIKISKIDVQNLHEYYLHPILNDRIQIFSAYMSLSKYLVENIQSSEIRKFLKNKGLQESDLSKDGNRLGSLKLFTLLLDKYSNLKNVDLILSPLFILYDLRNLHGHLSDDSFTVKYNNCKLRLKTNSEISDLDFFYVIIKALIKMYEKLNDVKFNKD